LEESKSHGSNSATSTRPILRAELEATLMEHLKNMLQEKLSWHSLKFEVAELVARIAHRGR
jgi:hypothetical protein